MIEKEFATPYNLVPTVITVCEDTANCIIEWPTDYVKEDIINFIDTNNYVCVGIYSDDLVLANNINYYLGGLVSSNHKDIITLRNQFS